MTKDIMEDIAHEEQIRIWVDEIIESLFDHIKEPETYDDVVHLHQVIENELKGICEQIAERLSEAA